MKFYQDKFRELRKLQRWTVVALAKKCEVTRQTVILWEKGKVTPPESRIRFLAKILNVRVSDISDIEGEVAVSEKSLAPIVNIWNSLSGGDPQSRMSTRNNFIKQIYDHFSEQDRLFIIIRALLNSKSSLFYVKDQNMKYLIANNSFLDNISSNMRCDVYGKKDQDFFSNYEAEKNNEEDFSVMKTGKAVINKEDYIIGSKKKRWGLISKYPVLDENNQALGVLCEIVDITEKKEMESVQKMVIDAFDRLDAGVGIYDITNRKLIYVNTGSPDTFGIKSDLKGDELLNFFQNNIIHPEDRESQKKYLTAPESIPARRTYRIIHPDKGLRTIEVHTSKIITPLKRKYILSLSFDITERIR